MPKSVPIPCVPISSPLGFLLQRSSVDILIWFHSNCVTGHGKNINEYNYQQFSKGKIF